MHWSHTSKGHFKPRPWIYALNGWITQISASDSEIYGPGKLDQSWGSVDFDPFTALFRKITKLNHEQYFSIGKYHTVWPSLEIVDSIHTLS